MKKSGKIKAREKAIKTSRVAFENQMAAAVAVKSSAAKKTAAVLNNGPAKKSGFWSIASRMRWAIAKFTGGDLQGDVYGLLEQVERCFPRWTTAMVLTYTARYLREAGDSTTADAILVTE